MIRTESTNGNSDTLLEVYVQFTKPHQYPANKDCIYIYIMHSVLKDKLSPCLEVIPYGHTETVAVGLLTLAATVRYSFIIRPNLIPRKDQRLEDPPRSPENKQKGQITVPS